VEIVEGEVCVNSKIKVIKNYQIKMYS